MEWNYEVIHEGGKIFPHLLKMIFTNQPVECTMWPIDQSLKRKMDPSGTQHNINKTVVTKSTRRRLPLGAAFIVGVTLGVSAVSKARRGLFTDLPDRVGDWQLEQLIRHSKGTN